MKIDQLIKELQTLKSEHGNLEVFTDDANSLMSVELGNDPKDWPKEYNMPKKWAILNFWL